MKRVPGVHAFSLTEVVVALGVATISIVSILALFPVGFDTVRESAAETQAAVLARTIAADLVSGARARGMNNSILLSGNDVRNPAQYVSVNLAQAGTYAVAYSNTPHFFGAANYEPFTQKAAGRVDNPTNAVSGADYIVELQTTPVPGLEGALAQVNVRVSSTGTLASSNRIVQNYSFLIGP
jgi:type II secretory pathway pseudopilin PulG